MPMTDWTLPGAFDPTGEKEKALAGAKSKLARSIKWSKAQCLYDAIRALPRRDEREGDS